MTVSTVEGALLGIAVGDALGVPHEFRQREQLRANPVTGMDGHGTHQQAPGVWSDDASLTFCLAESIVQAPLRVPPYVDVADLSARFVNWFENGYWTATGKVFDVGITTRAALMAIASGLEPADPAEFNEQTTGNGSLMRVLPLALLLRDAPSKELYHAVDEVSSVTHGHIRAVIGCYLYVEYARRLLATGNAHTAYAEMQRAVAQTAEQLRFPLDELAHFGRLLHQDIGELAEDDIQSSGYIVHTLEAAVWCLRGTRTLHDCLLRAVNLGDDTDTTASVAGGLAGILYGHAGIPAEWLSVLARRHDIVDLAQRLHRRLTSA